MNIQFVLAARYLWGRKLRTFLTTLAVVFGVLVIFGMNTMLPTMMASFQNNMRAASGQVDLSISRVNGDAFSPSIVNKVKAVEGVQAVSGTLRRTLNLPSGWFGRTSTVTAVSLVGVEPRDEQSVRVYSLLDGRFLRSSDEDAAVITQSLADQLGLKVGDDINLPTAAGTVSLKIVGLLPARALPGNEDVLVTLYEAQKLLDLPKRINTIDANYGTGDAAQRDAIATTVEAMLGDDYQIGGLASGGEFMTSLQTGQSAFTVFGFLALFMGGFIIFNTFRTIVAERRRDIGMLRTLGANRSTIIGTILTEGLLQGVIGTAIGMGLGYLMAAGMLGALSGMMEQYVHMKAGAPVITPGLIITTLVLGIGVTLVAGLLPAISASRLTPMEALRPSMADVVKRAITAWNIVGIVLIVLAILGLLSGNIGLVSLGGICFLIGLVLIAPALVKPISKVFGAMVAIAFARQGTGTLAEGNLTRQPSRAAITASATMIGLAVIVAMGVFTSSMSGGFMGVVRRSLGSDYLLIPPAIGVWSTDVGANRDLANKLRATRGVGVVSTMRYAAGSINGDAVSVLGIDPVAFPQAASLDFSQGDANTAYAQLAAGRALIANGILAKQENLKVGDLVEVSTATGVQTYYVAGLAGDYMNAKLATAYISHASIQNDFNKTEDIFIQFNLTPGADRAVVEPKIKAIVADYPQFQLVSGEAYFEQTQQLFQVVFASLYVLLTVLALPSLIAILNTLAIGVIERTREIGMLRAIGSTQGQVRQMVIAEALLLAATGTAFGLLAGLYLGYVMIGAYAAAGFPVEFSFTLSGLIVAIAIGLLFGVAAAIIPARQAARMEIVRALRYE